MPSEDVIYFDSEAGASLFDSADVKRHFWTISRYSSLLVAENGRVTISPFLPA